MLRATLHAVGDVPAIRGKKKTAMATPTPEL